MDIETSRSDLLSDDHGVYDEVDTSRMSMSLSYDSRHRHTGVIYHSESIFTTSSSSFQRAYQRSPRSTRRRTSKYYRNLNRKCNKLDRVNRRLTCIFYILASAVMALALLYAAFVGLILAALPKLRGDFPYCVDESNIGESGARRIWDNLTADIDWEYTVNKRCFADISWMPKLAKLVNNDIQAYAGDIEKRQNVTTKMLDESLFESHSLAKFYQNDTVDSRHLWNLLSEKNRSLLVFAHLSLDTKKPYAGSRDESALRWSMASHSWSSSLEGIGINFSEGELTISKGGYYLVYSRVTFRNTLWIRNGTTSHKVIKNHRDHSQRRITLMERLWTPRESFLQGMFQLRTGDTLAVVVPRDSVDSEQTKSQQKTYFGAYLVRDLDGTSGAP